jgi:hypothetical protein
VTRTSDALALAEETLRELELGAGALTPIVLRCLRLARLLDNVEAEAWLRLELRGYREGVGVDYGWEKYLIWSGRQSSKTPEGQQLYWFAPIEEIESELDVARNDLQALQLIPTSLTESGSGQKSILAQSTAEKILSSILVQRELKASMIRRWSHVLACVRGALEDWLAQVVVQLRYGAVVETAFQRSKVRFDAFLSTHAPDVARRLAAAYQRAYSDDPEEWSQALTSCRRALKALADGVYPPTEDQPSRHPLTDEHYKNRLVQFASDRLASESQRGLIVAEIESVMQRVDALNDLASKGVHSDVDERDLELTVVHTYLLAGELLQLLPESEPEPQFAAPQIDEEGSGGGSAGETSGLDPNKPIPPPSDT